MTAIFYTGWYNKEESRPREAYSGDICHSRAGGNPKLDIDILVYYIDGLKRRIPSEGDGIGIICHPHEGEDLRIVLPIYLYIKKNPVRGRRDSGGL